MNNFSQIILRVIPILIVTVLGYFGVQHWKKPVTDDQAKNLPHQSVTLKQKRPKGKRRTISTEALTPVPTFYQIQLETQGILSPANVTTLTPQVSGKIIYVSDNFQNGAFLKKGEVLLKLDPGDFDAAILSAEASLARSHANLAQEKARSEQALRNWQDIGFDEEPNDLVLRKPQLREAEANVKSAVADLERSRRNKQRCSILAPFAGVVRNRKVSLADSIHTSTDLGEILDTTQAEIKLPLSASQLNHLNFNNKNAIVLLTDALQPASEKKWQAKILRQEAEMDMESKELSFIARVQDPFNLNKTHDSALHFNQPLIATIPAQTLDNVILIDRKYVQGVNNIIGINDNKIQLLKVNPIWETKEFLIVKFDSLPKGLQIATRALPYATNGTPVTIIKPTPTASNK